MHKKGFWIGCYAVLLIAFILSVATSAPAIRMGPYRAIGLSLGAAAYFMMCAQIVLAARIPLLERVFGLDKLIRFHGMAAMAALVLSIAHPFVIHHGLFRIRWWSGENALLLYVVISILAIFFLTTLLTGRFQWAAAVRKWCEKNMALTRYRVQLLIHNVMIVAVIFMFLHVVFRYRGFGSNLPFTVLAVIAFGAAMAAYLWHTFLRRSYRYRVKQVVHENDSMTTLVLSPESGKSMNWKAGQFAYIRLKDPAVSTEWHPFSISSAPEDDLSFTIRNLGDWTGKVKEVSVGSQVRIDGPYGTFTPDQGNTPLILIAGGVGITPMIGIVGEALHRKEDRRILLFWCAKDRGELIRQDFWAKASDKLSHFTFCPVLSRDMNCGFEEGRFSSSIFLKYVEKSGISFADAKVYYCGPEPLRKTVHAVLNGEGVPDSRIHEERFSL